MPAPKLTRFRVRGVGRFPVDMLRYDSCWPASQADAAAIVRHVERQPRTFDDEIGTVTLLTHSRVTASRWASFGWLVEHEEVVR